MKLLTLLCVTILFNSCGTMKKNQTDAKPNGTYNFEIKTPSAEPTTAPLQITFNKDNTNFTGFSGCNRFSGNYTLSNQTLKLVPIITTRMACISNGLNAIETKLVNALNSVTAYKLKKVGLTETLEFYKGDELVLTATKTTPKNDVKS